MRHIAFVGLGNMGLPMAANLAKAGNNLVGFDPAPKTVEAMKAANVAPVASAAAAASGADVIVTMLPNGETLKSVYSEVVPKAKPGTLMIDCSTVDLGSTRTAHAMASKANLRSLDAPVSGGVGGAVAATLTFMVGGEQSVFEDAQPLFFAMGKKAVLCGDIGAGQAVKICNNMVLGISMLGICEAFVLADRLGISRQALFDVVSTSSGQCWSLNSYCPVPGIGPTSPADNDYRPGFAASLMLKDLRLSQQAADDVEAETPLGRLAAQIYSRFVGDGGATKDFSGVMPWLATLDRSSDELAS